MMLRNDIITTQNAIVSPTVTTAAARHNDDSSEMWNCKMAFRCFCLNLSCHLIARNIILRWKANNNVLVVYTRHNSRAHVSLARNGNGKKRRWLLTDILLSLDECVIERLTEWLMWEKMQINDTIHAINWCFDSNSQWNLPFPWRGREGGRDWTRIEAENHVPVRSKVKIQNEISWILKKVFLRNAIGRIMVIVSLISWVFHMAAMHSFFS